MDRIIEFLSSFDKILDVGLSFEDDGPDRGDQKHMNFQSSGRAGPGLKHRHSTPDADATQLSS